MYPSGTRLGSSHRRPPSWLLESVLCGMVIFGPLAFGAMETWSLAVLKILIFSLLALVMLRGGQARPAPSLLFWAAICVAAVGVLQGLRPVAAALPSGLLPFTVDADTTWRMVLQWTAYAALLWSVPQVLTGRPAVRRLVWALFLVGALVAIIGIAQWGQGNSAYYGLRTVRRGDPFGPYANRDHAASFLAMAMFSGLGLIGARAGRLRQAADMGRAIEQSCILLLSVFLLAVIGLGIWKTHSRGAINASAAAIWLVASLSTVRIETALRRHLARGVLALIALGYGLLLYLQPQWIGYVFSAPDVSTAYRLSMYGSGLHMLLDFPLFGIGLGGFQHMYPAYQEQLVRGLTQYAHSDWLELGISVGVLAALAYVVSLLVYLKHGLESWLACRSLEMSWLGAGVAAAVIAFILHGLVDFSFQIPANAAVFFILLLLSGRILVVASEMGGSES